MQINTSGQRPQAEESAFFALLSRTQLINRWSLMRNTWSENVQEHSFQTAMIAQALVFIRKAYYPDTDLCPDPDRVLARALFHDVTEVITGDLPTPVKYHDSSLTDAYQRLEDEAAARLLALLPANMRSYYEPYIQGPTCQNHDAMELEIQRFIKAADKLSALIKCRVELNQGNKEFSAAEAHTEAIIKDLALPEAQHFMEYFLDDYTETLDHYQV